MAWLIYLTMEFAADEPKKPVGLLAMDVPLKIVPLKLLTVIPQVTLKQIQFYLEGQAVATFVERKSRLIIVKRLQGRDSTSMTKAILELANQLEDNLKPLTVDHGKEFANYKLIEEQARIPLYFAHAYSPHERGSNENRNRVLRRFIPKGQPIEEITDDELIQINWYLNSRPLKCLNWRTPIEIFLRNLRH